MSLAILAPVGFHLAWFHRRSLWRWKWSLGAILGACLILFWPYLFYLFTRIHRESPTDRSAWLGWLYPLLGGHFLTLGAAGTMPGVGWQEFAPKIVRNIFAGAQWISRAALVAVWVGMILAIGRAWNALRRPGAAGVSGHLCLIALSAWICQTLLDGLEGIHSSPHYYGATWLAYVFLAWIAVDWAMSRYRRGILIVRTSIAIYAVSVLLGMGIVASTIAGNGGTLNTNYGTCLANQIAAVKEIRQFSNHGQMEIQVPQWQHYPLALQVLLELNPAPDVPRPPAHLVVKYRNAYPGDARIKVEEFTGS